MTNIALSTMWMQLKDERLAPFIETARDIGFPSVELSHIVTLPQLAQLPVEQYGAVRVLHHPCPNPGGVPELSDPDPVRRAAAIRAAQNTMTWAARLGARLVVLHLGRVAVDHRWENALRARFLQATPDAELLRHMLALRAAVQPVYWDAARRALDEIVPFAQAHDVQIGFETSEWIFSLPNLAESRRLLDSYPETAGYWVDTGHATILERLGAGALREWLTLAPERLKGVHLHDVLGLRDHLLPGRGTIDWQSVAPLIPPEAHRTAEVDWYYTEAELRAGLAAMKAIRVAG